MELSLLDGTTPGELPLELVERKGLGHPDTLCDALAENLSRLLSLVYLDRFGVILHHNVDKALLRGGAARPAFGGGEILEPIEIYLAGRATREVGGVPIPVDELAVEGSKRWLREHLRFLDVERDVRIIPLVRATSADLASLFQRRPAGSAPLANDTSLGVGFAPLDALERTVLAVERRLNDPVTKQRQPELGEDIKVMGVRRGAQTSLTVACAMVGRFITNLDDYALKKERLRALIVQTAPGAEVSVNAADGTTSQSVYLSVTGLSAEAGDDGQVGRGNRVNGLITPFRPMTLEAAAGKNPVTHVGKLYNLVAHRIAAALVAEVPGVNEASCALVSCIGRPITEPAAIDVKVRLDDLTALDRLRPRIGEVTMDTLATVTDLWRALLDGTQSVW
jgi:S-adenosylmethionine synthetase